MNQNPKSPKTNAEGYPDPTAYYGTKDAMRQEAALDKKVHDLMHIIRDLAALEGFDIMNRVILKHKRTGKEFK